MENVWQDEDAETSPFTAVSFSEVAVQVPFRLCRTQLLLAAVRWCSVRELGCLEQAVVCSWLPVQGKRCRAVAVRWGQAV